MDKPLNLRAAIMLLFAACCLLSMQKATLAVTIPIGCDPIVTYQFSPSARGLCVHPPDDLYGCISDTSVSIDWIEPAMPLIPYGSPYEGQRYGKYTIDLYGRNATATISIYTSKHKLLATFSGSTGNAFAVALGSVDIVPGACTSIDNIKVTPTDATVYLHHFDPKMKEMQFTATGSYSDGTMQNVTSSATWTTSDASIATVNAGLATPLKQGIAHITATQDGITSNNANLEVLCRNYTQYSQLDSRWSSKPYDHYRLETIGNLGCALTDMSMILDTALMPSYGVDPDSLNTWLNNNGGYFFGIWLQQNQLNLAKGWVVWDKLNNYPGGKVRYVANGDGYFPMSTIDQHVSSCKAVIIEIKRPTTGSYHWVLVTGKTDNGYRIIDPLSGSESIMPTFAHIYAYRVYSIQ